MNVNTTNPHLRPTHQVHIYNEEYRQEKNEPSETFFFFVELVLQFKTRNNGVYSCMNHIVMQKNKIKMKGC